MSLKRLPLINIVLFILTVVTTITCGKILFGGYMLAGIIYSFTVLAILFTHEMGHYLNAKWHKLDVTLPYFIPVPIGIGTMGAVIKMKSMAKERNALMDVGAAGPLWGFIASIIALAIGTMGAVIKMKSMAKERNALMDVGAAGPLWGFIASVIALAIGIAITPVYQSPLSQMFGASILYTVMSYLIKGVPPEYLAINPVLFAGWLGLFVTMLNLLPVGQLDGGHVTYAMFGKNKNYHKYIQGFFYSFMAWGVICLFVYHTPTWLMFGLIISIFGGTRHPPLDNEMIGLSKWNRIKGWACVVIFILTFMPSPFRM